MGTHEKSDLVSGFPVLTGELPKQNLSGESIPAGAVGVLSLRAREQSPKPGAGVS